MRSRSSGSARIGIEIDLKLTGIEARGGGRVRRHGLEERTFVSSTWAPLRSVASRRQRRSSPRAIATRVTVTASAKLRWPRVVTAAAPPRCAR